MGRRRSGGGGGVGREMGGEEEGPSSPLLHPYPSSSSLSSFPTPPPPPPLLLPHPPPPGEEEGWGRRRRNCLMYVRTKSLVILLILHVQVVQDNSCYEITYPLYAYTCLTSLVELTGTPLLINLLTSSISFLFAASASCSIYKQIKCSFDVF